MNTVIVNLHIVYDGTLHFYSRRENGRSVISARSIPAQRAADIMRRNEDDPAVVISQRQMERGFSWMAIIVQVEESVNA